MARIFVANGLTGYRLNPVEHIGSKKHKREVYQLVVINTLPPMAAEIRNEPIIGEHCPVCELTGIIKWPLPYSLSSLSAVNDFNLRLESIEYSKSLQRLLLISAKTRKSLLNFNIKRKGWFQPGLLINQNNLPWLTSRINGDMNGH